MPIEGTMNSDKYVELLSNHGLPWIRRRKQELGVDFIFLQDNAPCHVSGNSLSFLHENRVELLEWPPFSPDLSPIENIWCILKGRLGRTLSSVRNMDDLKAATRSIWLDVSQQQCAKLDASMPKRIEEVIRNKGRSCGRWKIKRMYPPTSKTFFNCNC